MGKVYDIIVIGAGPAGLTAALYARRADKKVLVLEKETFGGQITHSPRVENYPGFLSMSGTEFADKLLDQVFAQGADVELDEVTAVRKTEEGYKVFGGSETYEARAVIVATGSRHRTLGLPKEEQFVGEGVSYCAVCDGAFYKGKTVAVVGGGNTALQEVIMLAKLCKKVYVIQNLDFLTGESLLQKDIAALPNVEVILSSVVTELLGEEKFEGLEISTKGEKQNITVDGVFVAVGQKPENEPFRDIVELDTNGYVQADESCLPKGADKGIFVAGDCRTKSVRQIATAISDGASAAVAACRYLGY